VENSILHQILAKYNYFLPKILAKNNYYTRWIKAMFRRLLNIELVIHIAARQSVLLGQKRQNQ
jgi:hypothetical protein